MPTQEFISVSVWKMIMQIGNLLILCWGVKHFLFRPVLAILEKRKAEIDSAYEQADEAKTQAQAMRADYEQRLATAKEEAGEIVKTATARAQQRSDEMIAQAQEKAAAMLSKADAEIAQERKKAVNQLKDEVSGLAVDIASKMVEREISAKDHEKLIEEFIDNVG